MAAGISATATGGTLNVTGCAFTGDTTISKAITIVGGRVTGGEVLIRASDVTLDGLELSGGQAALQQGNIDADNVNRVTLRNVYVHDSLGSCMSIKGGTGHQILDSRFVRCQQEGYHLTGGISDVLVQGNLFAENNAATAPGSRVNPGWEAGGGKVTFSTNVHFIDNEAHSNGGPGLWADLGANDTTFTDNRVHHNTIGIFFEVSDGCDIGQNILWENGWSTVGSNAYGGGADIRISTSRGCMVHDNVMAWSIRGIVFLAQNRSESTTPSTYDGNRSENNVVISDGANNIHGWYQADGKRLDVPGNGSSGDRFWSAVAEPQSARFEWASSTKSTLATYAATPGGAGATYLTNAQKDAILAANGLPATP